MLGYSQGAQIIDDAFCGGPDLPSLESGGSLVTGLVRKNTAAIVLMGSPRFVGVRKRKGEKGNATVGGVSEFFFWWIFLFFAFELIVGEGGGGKG